MAVFKELILLLKGRVIFCFSLLLRGLWGMSGGVGQLLELLGAEEERGFCGTSRMS